MRKALTKILAGKKVIEWSHVKEEGIKILAGK